MDQGEKNRREKGILGGRKEERRKRRVAAGLRSKN